MAETFRGFLQGMVARARNSENKELEIIYSEILEKFKSFNPPTTLYIEGWKGRGEFNFLKNVENNFVVVEVYKNKETGEIEEHRTEVTKENINRMFGILRNLKMNVEYKCYYISNKLGYDWRDLWAVRKTYFEIYYYPLKCAEALGIIKYFGRGSIMRLK